MKKICYYHMYLTDDYGTWSSILMEQLKLMEDHGLIEQLDTIKFTVITPDHPRMDAFLGIIDAYPIKKEVQFIRNPFSNDSEMTANLDEQRAVTENVTMRKIWTDCQTEDIQVLYIHAKGITGVDRCLRSFNTEGFRLYYYWRQYLNWGVIENWRLCVNSLEHNDIAGASYRNWPVPHFSGAFWWANSSHIRQLPAPHTMDWWYKMKTDSTDSWLKNAPDRNRDELWHCHRPDVKIFKVHEPSENWIPAGKIFPRSCYDGKQNLISKVG